MSRRSPGRPPPAADALEAAPAPGLIAPHVFTFNSLVETAAWWRERERRA
ncbi:hypothetical protein Y09_2647 [Brachybacterium sp. SW0106-09]|nr:hypothetical protein Y09_2647 [Brachybacterium sp. SW0106-09]